MLGRAVDARSLEKPSLSQVFTQTPQLSPSPETDSPDKEQAPASQGCHPAAAQHSTGNLKHQAPYGRGPEPNDILL